MEESAVGLDGRTLAERLKAARADAGLTQNEVAAKTGLSRQTIAQHEGGKIRTIPDETLQKYVKVYRRSFAYLRVGREETPTTPRAPQLSQRIREWVYTFLAELAKGGATELELEEVRTMLTAESLTAAFRGGPNAAAQRSDDDVIRDLEVIAEKIIRRHLRKLGRKV